MNCIESIEQLLDEHKEELKDGIYVVISNEIAKLYKEEVKAAKDKQFYKFIVKYPVVNHINKKWEGGWEDQPAFSNLVLKIHEIHFIDQFASEFSSNVDSNYANRIINGEELNISYNMLNRWIKGIIPIKIMSRLKVLKYDELNEDDEHDIPDREGIRFSLDVMSEVGEVLVSCRKYVT